ncbi:MAG: DUF1272 domain-containing protein [Myxococcota bacterium]
MLELRPSCEHCAKPLPPSARDARICSFECTFCAECVEKVLLYVCPNCGGDFCSRPVRPQREWRAGESLKQHPASERVRYRPVDAAAHAEFASSVRLVDPHER